MIKGFISYLPVIAKILFCNEESNNFHVYLNIAIESLVQLLIYNRSFDHFDFHTRIKEFSMIFIQMNIKTTETVRVKPSAL